MVDGRYAPLLERHPQVFAYTHILPDTQLLLTKAAGGEVQSSASLLLQLYEAQVRSG